MSPEERFARHMAFFGADGQRRISASRVAIVGLGGLGSHLAQQLAYLGVGSYVLIDADTVATSNLNRLIGATAADTGSGKVDLAARMISGIQPGAEVDRQLEALQRHGREPPHRSGRRDLRLRR